MRIISFALLLACAFDLCGQSWTATTDAKQVTTNSVFQVTFTLENAQGSNFRAPDFSEYDYVSGPAQSRATSIINGVMTQSQSFTYSLMRSKPGKYTIGPATIQVGSKKLSTLPVTIEVVEGRISSPGGTEDVFLKAELSSTTAYPGQQVHLDYKIYTTVNVRNYNTLAEDDYDQFYYRYVQDFNNRAQLEVVNGVQYTVQKIKSIALFPQQAGSFVIEPMIANLGISLKEDRMSIFYARTVPKTVASDSLVLRVMPLPPDAPPSFNGAVGTYSMDAKVNRQSLSTDDALVLTLEILGDGDPKRWSVPALDSLGRDYELYDPKILMDESADQGGQIRHRRAIEYLLIPREAGDRTLKIDFSYFDPVAGQYKTLSTPEFALSVAQGTHRKASATVFDAASSAYTMRGLKPYRASGHFQFLFSPLYFMLLALPGIALGVTWIRRRKEDAFAALDPAEKKRRKAHALATKYLREAHQYLDGNERDFSESLSRAIFSYFSAKLNIPGSELSKANIAANLQRINIPQDLIGEVKDILLTNEQVLYAGTAFHADRRAIYDRTMTLIERIEKVLEQAR